MQSSSDTPNPRPPNVRLSTGSAITTGFQPTESEILTTVGDWLLTALPAGFVVRQGQQNQTPNPLGNFATMTIVSRERRNTDSIHYEGLQRITKKSVLLTIQVDVWGDGAGNAAEQVETLWRSPSSCEFFSNNRKECAPTHADKLHQQGFTTAEHQYSDHWIVHLMLNAITHLTAPQESALEVSTGLINSNIPTKIINPSKRKIK